MENLPGSDLPGRWDGVERRFTPEDVRQVSGTYRFHHDIANRGARRLWQLLEEQSYIHALGAVTGGQAVQQVRAGLEAIYLSGWQVAADGNSAGEVYPDQSLYPANSVPLMVDRLNNALLRQDQIETFEGNVTRDWLVPIVADAEAGFGGDLNAYLLTRGLVKAGAAGVHFEDQVASQKKCGHLGGKVLVPTTKFIRTLTAARLAADVCDVPTVLIARTDADSAKLLESDIDPCDHRFITSRERTSEGYYRVTGGLDMAIARGLAYAPYADLLWCETSTPDLEEAQRFADAIHAEFPGKKLAYNCSPSFNWRKKMPREEIAHFQHALGEMGYRFQFVTLAGFHALNYGMFDLADRYHHEGMAAYSDLQEAEFVAERERGFTAVKHQREVGVSLFDKLQEIISGGETSTTALKDSTETVQFKG